MCLRPHKELQVFISLKDLELRAVPFKLEIQPGEIDYDSEITQASVLKTEGTASLLNHSLGEIRVQGKLDVAVEALCDRCLEPVKFPVGKRFDLIYMPAEVASASGENEIDRDGIEVGYYEGGGLALNDILREVVLLALPMQLICEEDCKGICPACGQNRNQVDCGCHVAASDDRWSKLKEFRAETGPRN